MNDNQFTRIFCIVAFLAFAAVSCWATAESLHLLLSSWPLAMCWIVTVGFFFIASFGSKMIADSFNQNIYVEKRGTKLIIGVLILLIFWLMCSMPTNTHTFFFRSLINQEVSKDISNTQGYLAQIRDNVVTEDRIKQKQAELSGKVEIKLGDLKAEIFSSTNPGNGPEAKRILKEFAELLGVDKIDPISFVGHTPQQLQHLNDDYRTKIYALRDAKMRNIDQEMRPASDAYRKIAKADYENLDLVKENIASENLILSDAQDCKVVCDQLNQGYSTIRTYKNFVVFPSEPEKNAYCEDKAQTRVQRLLSVYDVWMDFLTGKAGGLSFCFWILISVLVDIAAFIFFDIAFKKNDY